MTQPRQQPQEPATTSGTIERLAGGLELGEEPARFIAALEDGAEMPRDE